MRIVRFVIIASVLAALTVFTLSVYSQQPVQTVIDPAAWGGNHVGKPLPEYVHGDECLFCHRNDIGTTWQKNTHGIAVRTREDAPELVQKLNPPQDVEFFLGSRREGRLLKKDGYGKFALLGKGPNPAWDKERFAKQC